jgi:hypothetical protein
MLQARIDVNVRRLQQLRDWLESVDPHVSVEFCYKREKLLRALSNLSRRLERVVNNRGLENDKQCFVRQMVTTFNMIVNERKRYSIYIDSSSTQIGWLVREEILFDDAVNDVFGVEKEFDGYMGDMCHYKDYICSNVDDIADSCSDKLRYGYCYLLAFDRKYWSSIVDNHQPKVSAKELLAMLGKYPVDSERVLKITHGINGHITNAVGGFGISVGVLESYLSKRIGANIFTTSFDWFKDKTGYSHVRKYYDYGRMMSVRQGRGLRDRYDSDSFYHDVFFM